MRPGSGQAEAVVLGLADLRRALSSSIDGRDKVAVVHADASLLSGADSLESLARDLALLRALNVRLLVTCAPGPGATGLVAALARHGAKGILLPAASVVRAAAPGVLTKVDVVLLVQLASLSYIPIVMPPALGPSDAAIEVHPDALAAGLAVFTAAERLVFAGGAPSEETARMLTTFGRSWLADERPLLESFLLEEART